MRLLIHSNAPWAATGYGQQTRLLAHRFRELGHDVAISAFYGLAGGIIEWNGLTVYPSDDTDKFGCRRLRLHAKTHSDTGDPRDCLVLTLMDVWALGPKAVDGLRVASWVPVDHQPVPPRVFEFFALGGARPIAMSRFGERELRDVGLDPLYVPHAVDTSIFRPMPGRDEIRRSLGLPVDAFVIGMVANNQGNQPARKAFPEVFEVFAAFQKAHRDAFLWVHSDMLGFRGGLNLAALAEVVGIPPDAGGFTDQEKHYYGLEPEQMAGLYSAFDVLANPSYGEGFGIPIVEAQACGCPVVVTNCTSMPELVGAGWLVEGDPYYDCGHGAFWKRPALADLYDAFEEAYEHAAGIRDQAQAFAAGYDVEHVLETYWKPVLAELEDEPEIVIRELVAA